MLRKLCGGFSLLIVLLLAGCGGNTGVAGPTLVNVRVDEPNGQYFYNGNTYHRENFYLDVLTTFTPETSYALVVTMSPPVGTQVGNLKLLSFDTSVGGEVLLVTPPANGQPSQYLRIKRKEHGVIQYTLNDNPNAVWTSTKDETEVHDTLSSILSPSQPAATLPSTLKVTSDMVWWYVNPYVDN